MSDVRQRREKGAPSPSQPEDKSKTRPAPSSPWSYTGLFIAFGALSFFLVILTWAMMYVTAKRAGIRSLNTYLPFRLPVPTTLMTDGQLIAYNGEDPDKPIYVAINRRIFDVSAGRSFYGPGGHYHHFAGRDATRAWVTTCFEEEHLTYDLKGVDTMFMPKWLDEEIEAAAAGNEGVLGEDKTGALKEQALKALQRVGKVGQEEKAKRRTEDTQTAKVEMDKALKHWVDFFKNNKRYLEVGKVVGRAPLPESRKPIPLCDTAMKKRPVKGGKLGAAMEKAIGGAGAGKAAGGMPDFVKGGS